MSIVFQPAPPDLAAEYISLRGLTRENAISEGRLRAWGITAESWANGIKSEEIQGFVALSDERMIGYCFGSLNSGEVVVLAVLPAFEGQGIGQRLLDLLVQQLQGRGHTRLFLGCSPDPAARSYGFYRRLGWVSTGSFDTHGDEVLELIQR